MADFITSSRVQSVVLSAVGFGSCMWLLRRRAQECAGTSQEVCVDWRQVAPVNANEAEIKEFGETNLQAKLITKRLPVSVMRQRSSSYLNLLNSRRTMRFYSKDDVPRDVLENCLAAAGTSPSGAHHQPWFFALVRTDQMKQNIRELVEAEEKVNYERRMR